MWQALPGKRAQRCRRYSRRLPALWGIAGRNESEFHLEAGAGGEPYQGRRCHTPWSPWSPRAQCTGQADHRVQSCLCGTRGISQGHNDEWHCHPLGTLAGEWAEHDPPGESSRETLTPEILRAALKPRGTRSLKPTIDLRAQGKLNATGSTQPSVSTQDACRSVFQSRTHSGASTQNA